ncbi:UPF0690 protein C1orf52 homolog [Styela clava]
MSDPLSFFAANSDDSDSEDDNSDKEDASIPVTKPAQQTVKPGNKKLPPPMTVLASAKRPEFTIDPLRQDVDWDKLTKKAPELPEKEYKPWENRLPTVEKSVKTKDGTKQSTLAQQVPGASAPNVADGPAQGRPHEYIDQAVQWSKMYQTMDKSGNIKRVKPQDIGGEDLEGFLFTDLEAEKVAYNGNKRQKMDQQQPPSFRSKEAKKRTMGMANRDKMFVEEEKRLLRQEFDANY